MINLTTDFCPSALTPSHQHPTAVLVVDDEPMIRYLLAWMLNREGYTVLSAADGTEALEMSKVPQSGFFSVLITDLCLPEMSGIALAAELRSARPELKALFVSGLSEDAFAELGADMSQAAFLAKPFNAHQLCAAVRELTERRASLC